MPATQPKLSLLVTAFIITGLIALFLPRSSVSRHSSLPHLGQTLHNLNASGLVARGHVQN